MLVFLPAILIDRFTTKDCKGRPGFMTCPTAGIVARFGRWERLSLAIGPNRDLPQELAHDLNIIGNLYGEFDWTQAMLGQFFLVAYRRHTRGRLFALLSSVHQYVGRGDGALPRRDWVEISKGPLLAEIFQFFSPSSRLGVPTGQPASLKHACPSWNTGVQIRESSKWSASKLSSQELEPGLAN
jgi:hypothetical protein